MSDVSKTNELIQKFRELSDRIFNDEGKTGDFRLIDRAADALATRVPVQGEQRRHEVAVAARQNGKTSQLVESLLALAEERGLDVRIVEPDENLKGSSHGEVRAVQGEPNDELELVDVVLTTADIEQLAHLLVQLPPATHKNSGATIRRLLQEMNIKEVGEVSASQVESNDDLEEMSAVEEALRQVLERQEAWHCNRVWEAWSVGTMTQDDFSLVTEDPVAVEELVQAATSAMARAAVPDAATETLNGLDVHDWAKIARAKEEAVEASVSAIERVRAIAKDGVWCDTKTSGDWAWALDHMAHKVLAALDGAPEPEELELPETGLELRDSDGDMISSGEHRRVLHQGGYVCDTCVNILGINVRWDRADRMEGHTFTVDVESKP